MELLIGSPTLKLEVLDVLFHCFHLCMHFVKSIGVALLRTEDCPHLLLFLLLPLNELKGVNFVLF